MGDQSKSVHTAVNKKDGRNRTHETLPKHLEIVLKEVMDGGALVQRYCGATDRLLPDCRSRKFCRRARCGDCGYAGMRPVRKKLVTKDEIGPDRTRQETLKLANSFTT